MIVLVKKPVVLVNPEKLNKNKIYVTFSNYLFRDKVQECSDDVEKRLYYDFKKNSWFYLLIVTPKKRIFRSRFFFDGFPIKVKKCNFNDLQKIDEHQYLTLAQQRTLMFVEDREEKGLENLLGYRYPNGLFVSWYTNYHFKTKKLSPVPILIANETGSGKTLIGLLLVAKTGGIVVIPNLLFSHWKKESEKVEKNFVFIEKVKDIPLNYKPNEAILVNYNTFLKKQFYEFFLNNPPQRLIIDEIHMLTKTELKILPTKSLIGITATPSYKCYKIFNIYGSDLIWGKSFIEDQCTIKEKAILKTKQDFVIKRIQRNSFLDKVFLTMYNEFEELTTDEFKTIMDKNGTKLCRILERISHGGFLQEDLILDIVKSLMKPTKIDPSLYKDLQKAPAPAFCDSKECSVCMLDFDLPVQFNCGHVSCHSCYESIKQYNNQCMLCRSLINNIYLPSFYLKNEDEKKNDIFKLKDTGIEHLVKYDEMVKEYTPKKRIVIYSTYLSSSYYKFLENKSFLTAGFFGGKKETQENIQKFIDNEDIEILFAHSNLTTGFDFYNVHEVWFLSVDHNFLKYQQGKGRASRISQKNDVLIKIFLYEHWIDDYIFTSQKSLVLYSSTFMSLLEFMSRRILNFNSSKRNFIIPINLRKFYGFSSKEPVYYKNNSILYGKYSIASNYVKNMKTNARFLTKNSYLFNDYQMNKFFQ